MVSKKLVVNFFKLPFSIITFFLNFTNSIILKHHLCVSDNLKPRAIINNIKSWALCSAMSLAKEAYFVLSQTISFMTRQDRHPTWQDTWKRMANKINQQISCLPVFTHQETMINSTLPALERFKLPTPVVAYFWTINIQDVLIQDNSDLRSLTDSSVTNLQKRTSNNVDRKYANLKLESSRSVLIQSQEKFSK